MKIRLSDEDRKKIEQAKEHLYKAQHILEEFCADKIECNCVINTKGKNGKGNCPYEPCRICLSCSSWHSLQ